MLSNTHEHWHKSALLNLIDSEMSQKITTGVRICEEPFRQMQAHHDDTLLAALLSLTSLSLPSLLRLSMWSAELSVVSGSTVSTHTVPSATSTQGGGLISLPPLWIHLSAIPNSE